MAASCEKDASIKSKNYTSIICQEPESEADGFRIKAEIVKPDSENIIRHGFVINDKTAPGSEYSLKVVINSPVSGSFSYLFNAGLKVGKRYFVRAYGETSSYKTYSNEVNFVCEFCEPPVITGFNPTSGTIGSKVVLTGSYFSPSVKGNEVRFGNVLANVDSASENRLVITLPEVSKPEEVIVNIKNESGQASSSQKFQIIFPWIKKNGYPGTPIKNTNSFEINGIIYVVGGARPDIFQIMKEFWEYDPKSDQWTRKPDFPGDARNNAISFSCNGKGYYGMGTTSSNNIDSYIIDLWEYDPVSENWSQKADFPGIPVIYSKSFTINNKAYIGPGYYWRSGNIQFVNQVWEYNPSNNSWTKKKEFPGTSRYFGIATSTENKGYLGLGTNGWKLSDFYEYDPVLDSWNKAGDYPGKGSNDLACFSIKGRLYVGLGCDNSANNFNDMWEFDPDNGEWKELQRCPSAFSPDYNISMNNKGYMGNCSGYTHSMFYEFDSDQSFK